MVEQPFQREVFFCSCGSNEHQAILSYDPEEKEYLEVYLSVHLSQGHFVHRLIYGIKYIFGHTSRYGAFSEICLNPSSLKRFSNFINSYLANYVSSEKH
jgi:hypothetical protein